MTLVVTFSYLHTKLLPQLRSRDPEGREEFDQVVNDLNATEDGEAGEEPHGAADEAELGHQGHLHILLYLVIGGSVEEDLNQRQGSVLNDRS